MNNRSTHQKEMTSAKPRKVQGKTISSSVSATKTLGDAVHNQKAPLLPLEHPPASSRPSFSAEAPKTPGRAMGIKSERPSLLNTQKPKLSAKNSTSATFPIATVGSTTSLPEAGTKSARFKPKFCLKTEGTKYPLEPPPSNTTNSIISAASKYGSVELHNFILKQKCLRREKNIQTQEMRQAEILEKKHKLLELDLKRRVLVTKFKRNPLLPTEELELERAKKREQAKMSAYRPPPPSQPRVVNKRKKQQLSEDNTETVSKVSSSLDTSKGSAIASESEPSKLLLQELENIVQRECLNLFEKSNDQISEYLSLTSGRILDQKNNWSESFETVLASSSSGASTSTLKLNMSTSNRRYSFGLRDSAARTLQHAWRRYKMKKTWGEIREARRQQKHSETLGTAESPGHRWSPIAGNSIHRLSSARGRHSLPASLEGTRVSSPLSPSANLLYKQRSSGLQILISNSNSSPKLTSRYDDVYPTEAMFQASTGKASDAITSGVPRRSSFDNSLASFYESSETSPLSEITTLPKIHEQVEDLCDPVSASSEVLKNKIRLLHERVNQSLNAAAVTESSPPTRLQETKSEDNMPPGNEETYKLRKLIEWSLQSRFPKRNVVANDEAIETQQKAKMELENKNLDIQVLEQGTNSMAAAAVRSLMKIVEENENFDTNLPQQLIVETVEIVEQSPIFGPVDAIVETQAEHAAVQFLESKKAALETKTAVKSSEIVEAKRSDDGPEGVKTQASLTVSKPTNNHEPDSRGETEKINNEEMLVEVESCSSEIKNSRQKNSWPYENEPSDFPEQKHKTFEPKDVEQHRCSSAGFSISSFEGEGSESGNESSDECTLLKKTMMEIGYNLGLPGNNYSSFESEEEMTLEEAQMLKIESAKVREQRRVIEAEIQELETMESLTEDLGPATKSTEINSSETVEGIDPIFSNEALTSAAYATLNLLTPVEQYVVSPLFLAVEEVKHVPLLTLPVNSLEKLIESRVDQTWRAEESNNLEFQGLDFSILEADSAGKITLGDKSMDAETAKLTLKLLFEDAVDEVVREKLQLPENEEEQSETLGLDAFRLGVVTLLSKKDPMPKSKDELRSLVTTTLKSIVPPGILTDVDKNNANNETGKLVPINPPRSTHALWFGRKKDCIDEIVFRPEELAKDEKKLWGSLIPEEILIYQRLVDYITERTICETEIFFQKFTVQPPTNAEHGDNEQLKE